MDDQVVSIKSVGKYNPERIMSNHEFPAELDTSHEWIVDHTGIHQRHLAAPDQAASDLAYEAAKIAIARAGIDASEIGLLIVATTTPDYYGFPSTACVLQEKLGCIGSTAFDISAACSGFVYMLEIAKAMLRCNNSYRYALIVGSEVLSSVINWNDRGTAILLGDGAGAAVIERSPEGAQILDSLLKADGSGYSQLLLPEGGSRCPLTAEILADPKRPLRNKLEMNGRAVYNFAVGSNQEIIQELLKRNNLKPEDIKYFVLHQANERIIHAVAKREHIPIDKFFVNIQDYANTSAASIPIALNEMIEKDLLQKGDLVLTVGFGSGLTYGGNLIRW